MFSTATPDWKSKCRLLLLRHIPVLRWIPFYSTRKLWYDLLAGFTVALTEVPQGIAFAVVAGLDPQYGLYSGFMGVFVYFIFGSCKDLNIGPTSILALMIQPHVEKMGPDMAVLITFLSGIIIVVLGFLQLGFILEFFSYPVISGFTTAAALQIASTQLKSLFGISGKSSKFLNAWIEFFENISHTRKWDTILGFTCIIFIMGIKSLGKRKNIPNTEDRRSRIFKLLSVTLWFFSLISYAIVLVIATTVAFLLSKNGHSPFILTGTVKGGLPGLSLPPFGTVYENQTFTFLEMLKQYGSTTAFLPLVAILEDISISKAFAFGKTVDATQELLALGVCNLASSFCRSMPVTGSFTRTAVNHMSGVQTTAGGLFTGCFVLLVLAFLTSSFSYIPKATLAAVVITAMIYLIQYDTVPILWRTKRLDLVPYFATLLCCLLWNLEYGIIIGILTNILFVLYESARPEIKIESRTICDKFLFVATPETGRLHFPASEYLKKTLLESCTEVDSIVLINGKYIKSIDATVTKSLKGLASELKLRHQTALFWNFNDNIKFSCLSFDRSLRGHFVDGTIEDIIHGTFEDSNRSLCIN